MQVKKNLSVEDVILIYGYAEAIVETVREPIVILDQNLYIRTANKSFFDTFRVTKKATYNKSIFEIGNNQWNIPALKKLLLQILPKNSVFNDFEVTHNFEKIGKRSMLLNARRIILEGHKTELILLAIEDVTERINAQEELKIRLLQQEAVATLGQHALKGISLQALMDEAISLIVSTLDVDLSKILQLLPDKQTLLLRAGYGWKKGLVGHLKISAAIDNLGGYALHHKKPVIFKNLKTEKRFKSPQVHYDHGITSGFHVVISGGKGIAPFGILGACSKTPRTFTKNDTNFLQAMANILSEGIARKETEERKDEFLSMASHELKTPLTSIKVYSKVLQKLFKNSSDHKNAHIVGAIYEHADTLSLLIADFLDLEKIEGNKLVLKLEAFDISNLISKIIEDFQTATERQNIYKEGLEKLIVVGDSHRIRQVIVNLLSNAIKFSQPEDPITIRTSAKKDTVFVHVQDLGKGIPESKQKYVFDKYFRAEEKNDEGEGGFGIGLYISAEIIERHQGKIWLESVENKGTTFIFSIPGNQSV